MRSAKAEEMKDGTLPEPESGFWAVVELFGHQRLAGFVSEHQLGGETFVRVDVPAVKRGKGFTRLFGKGAIYSLNPMGETIARHLVELWKPVPIQPFEFALPAIEDRSGDGD